jgi:serine/threonine protein kinase
MFRELVEGMCYMNAKGKMHRDLKPDNIILGP